MNWLVNIGKWAIKNGVWQYLTPILFSLVKKIFKKESKMNPLEAQLEQVFSSLWDDLRKLKGFEWKTIWKAIVKILSTAPMAIPLWATASRDEKRSAVVNVVNAKIDIPVLPESIEAWAFGYIYDFVEEKLNL